MALAKPLAVMESRPAAAPGAGGKEYQVRRRGRRSEAVYAWSIRGHAKRHDTCALPVRVYLWSVHIHGHASRHDTCALQSCCAFTRFNHLVYANSDTKEPHGRAARAAGSCALQVFCARALVSASCAESRARAMASIRADWTDDRGCSLDRCGAVPPWRVRMRTKIGGVSEAEGTLHQIFDFGRRWWASCAASCCSRVGPAP